MGKTTRMETYLEPEIAVRIDGLAVPNSEFLREAANEKLARMENEE